MFITPPIPNAGRNLNILKTVVSKHIFFICVNLYPILSYGLLYKLSPSKWKGVATICVSTGVEIWAILKALSADTFIFSSIFFPKIGGNVNADAMAKKSLKKNNPNDFHGKGLTSHCPKYCAKHLSFMIPVDVLNTKTVRSFESTGSTKGSL